ncbi:ATP/DNA BINDING PROTEIN-RELATED [Salix viminalis]|uniref:ATP/DNA BINDING PROTEIN-RELATED n=1 Tax=Salix viminalis TaxID=40686 RepID=A0A9Q0NV45_SALVM|nr:ATP/DNA BINDING PROTEIN-RELATED [Salix viminalis]
MASPKQHIEHIRKNTFSIGGEKNPLAPMLDQAVKYLSAELYAKDVHFLMELIQNAEDNEYLEEVDPSLEFVITSRDITNTGAPATLLMFNNEKGFSAKNIESICSVGNSTKKGNRKLGYIGEKGIGFKSVFLIASQPYIFSNGYQIRFNEKPCPHCNLGYIVPEWVGDNPFLLSHIKQIYGSASTLPTTTLVLPLKPDKVNPVKQQLSSIHPEILLFLSKIKRLSVREDNEDPSINTVSAVAITRETNFVQRKNIDAESYTLHLSADENGDEFEKECSYYLWKQKFPVRQENRVDLRMGVENWVITLAFPNGERLHRGMKYSPGIYAFLPTEMVTNFPFIIQADFILASSRETIRWDNIWNQGILDCVPSAFIEALVSLVKTVDDAPLSSLPRMFRFLPVHSSPFEKLNPVRDSIKAKLAEKDIIPSESYTEQKFFHKPREVCRLMPAFWNILKKTREGGVSLHKLSSHGCYVLNFSFDKPEYDHILDFLGVRPVSSEWYVKCIQGSNIVMGVSEATYLELLHFLAVNWQSEFHSTSMGSIPLIKYVGIDGRVSLCSVNESSRQYGKNLRRSLQSTHASWLIDWNREFRCMSDLFFVPRTTEEAICSSSNKEVVSKWLVDWAKVTALSVYDFADFYRDQVSCDQKLVIAYAHFLYHSSLKGYLQRTEVSSLCGKMPLVDSYGYVIKARNAVLVPASESKWMQLIGSNPWRAESYIELGEDYLQPGYFAGTSTVGKKLVDFLKAFAKATDIPHISPPNAAIPTASTQLTKKNAFLLLDWIRELKRRNCIPERFMACIREGNWLKITMNGFPGYKPPSQSFLLPSSNRSSNWGNILQNGSVLVDIPLVDQVFYGPEITGYWEELRTVGVMFESPVGSVLYDQEWTTARQISDIPFIDQDFYGKDILVFKPELQLLGVVVAFNGSYQLVVDYLKSPSCLSNLTMEAFLLVLDCMCHSNSAHKLVDALKSTKCVKTNLVSMEATSSLTTKELKDLGVKVDFEDAVKVFVQTFTKEASLSSITKDNVLSFLSCYRTLKETPYRFPSDLKKCIREVKWLRTRLGDLRSPSNCILFGPEWKLIHPITRLPFIDVKYYGIGIHQYQKELKSMGVIVEFKAGVKFVAAGLCFPQDPRRIAPENVLSLLQCVRVFLEEKDHSFPEAFLKNVSRGWLKTHAGFRSPGNCCLFNSQWSSHVRPTDGPFIDEDYYGFDIKLYSKELSAIGVDGTKVCTLLASHLDSHSEFDAIVRVYDFLRENKWKPDSDDTTRKICIPDGLENEMWVNPEECVLHDKDGLFGLQLNVLENHYEPKLLHFFSSSFNVRSNPSFDDYCKLWKVWESLERPLTQAECCAFWKCAMMQRSSRAERTLADDLQNLPSLPRTRLLEVYKKIGVRTISESVLKEELSLADGVELSQMDLRDAGIGEELIRLILGFLANPSLDMEATKRQGAVQCLLNLKVLETMEPITVGYSLSLSDGEVLKVEASCMIRWDKECSKFFTQKMDKAGGQKNLIEYATSFSKVIARGVLWDKEDQIKALSELIKLAFLLNFDEQAVKFLMQFNNLQTFLEDEEYLNAAFPSV